VPPDARPERLIRRHLLIGWAGVCVFLTLGIVLEGMHGFKVPWYLSAANETRRLMWRLAHAHGTLFSLVHVGFAATIAATRRMPHGALTTASACLTAALVMMPLGFFLGGIWLYHGDPGRGIILVPVGAILLLVGLVSLLFAVWRSRLP
jgi:hypothetical protein